MNSEEKMHGQKYFVNIEGKEYPWNKDTINAQEIRSLAQFPAGVPIVEEFPDGTERTLSEGEEVHLKPGHGFGRSPKFKRG